MVKTECAWCGDARALPTDDVKPRRIWRRHARHPGKAFCCDHCLAAFDAESSRTESRAD